MRSPKRRLKSLGKRLLARWGYRLAQAPSVFAEDEGSELTLTFDHVIHHHLAGLEDPSSLVFVQIGAFDGVTNDPLHDFVLRYGWRGILVEPQPEVFRLLEKTYRDQSQLILENAALAATDGEIPIYRLEGGSDDPADWRRQQTTFRREILLRLRHRIPDIEDRIVQETVQAITFDTLLARYDLPCPDLLQIDTEGFDFEVLKLFDLSRRRPSILHFEHQHLAPRERQEAWRYLVENGYRIAREGSVDTVAVRKRPELKT